MSEIKVNKISPATGTETTLGDSSDDFLLPSGAEIIAQSGSTITIASGATLANAGTATGFGGGGKILQVISAYSTVVQHTTAVSTWTDLTGMTVTITPSATASKIWIMANITGSAGTSEYGGIRLLEGGSAVAIGTGVSSQTPATSFTEPTVGGYTGSNMPISWIASPATTSAVIYKIQMYATGNVYMNRTVSDVDGAATMRTVSTITAIELESATVTGT